MNDRDQFTIELRKHEGRLDAHKHSTGRVALVCGAIVVASLCAMGCIMHHQWVQRSMHLSDNGHLYIDGWMDSNRAAPTRP